MALLRTVFAAAVLAVGLQSSAGLADEKPAAFKRDAKLGLVMCYAGTQTVRAFLKSTPCVSGTWWHCHREGKECWIGTLHYPTENTADYKPAKGKRGAPRYYVAIELKIRKRAGLPIDVGTFRGALVLKDPKPGTPLAVNGDDTIYELVGYQDMQNKKASPTHLFVMHPELRYVPKPVKAKP